MRVLPSALLLSTLAILPSYAGETSPNTPTASAKAEEKKDVFNPKKPISIDKTIEKINGLDWNNYVVLFYSREQGNPGNYQGDVVVGKIKSTDTRRDLYKKIGDEKGDYLFVDFFEVNNKLMPTNELLGRLEKANGLKPGSIKGRFAKGIRNSNEKSIVLTDKRSDFCHKLLFAAPLSSVKKMGNPKSK